MATAPQEITKRREPDRQGKTPEERQTMAVENIADTLEALRIDIVAAIATLNSPQRRSGL